jgi:hypothetical protein
VFLAAFLAASGLFAVPSASAAPTTIYVDADYRNCSDYGSGTAWEPFCMIQDALDIVEPGQTVRLYDTDPFYQNATLTRSGTEDAPITITSVTGAAYVAGPTGPGFTISGAHDIVVRGVEFGSSGSASTEAIVLDNASRITLDQLYVAPKVGQTALRITDSSAVTVSRSTISSAVRSTGVHVTRTGELTLARNTISYGVLVDGFTTLAIAGNRIYGRCAPALTVTGPNDAASIQNNVFVRRADPACPTLHTVDVGAAAASTTTLDYNNTTSSVDAYLWAGTSYDTPAGLHAGTGQAAHDLTASQSAPAPLYDNANADAPGATLIETAVDRTDTPNTGAGAVTYLDRGPYEYP